MNIIIKEIDNEEKIGKNTGNTYRPYNIKTFFSQSIINTLEVGA